MRSGFASGSTCTLVPIRILSVRAAIAVPRTSGLAARARRLSKCSSASHITSRPYSSLASPHYSQALAAMLGLPLDRIHLHEGHVGGGFGIRGELYPEDVLTCA